MNNLAAVGENIGFEAATARDDDWAMTGGSQNAHQFDGSNIGGAVLDRRHRDQNSERNDSRLRDWHRRIRGQVERKTNGGGLKSQYGPQ
jgi:hypothetical protein